MRLRVEGMAAAEKASRGRATLRKARRRKDILTRAGNRLSQQVSREMGDAKLFNSAPGVAVRLVRFVRQKFHGL